jgi:RNA polymerase sigma-70 factor (ECF subfamily)
MSNREPYDVSKLTDLIANGNQLAFQKLFDHYRNRVYGIAYKLTQSRNTAEEIVEDVFLKIWIKRADLSAIQNFSAYLFTIARNCSYRALKKIARDYRISAIPEEELSLSHNETEEYVAEKEYKELLDSAINKLPKQQKLVFRLIKEQGLKREEVATVLRLSPETVKFHLSQAVKNIRTFCVRNIEMLIVFLFGTLPFGNFWI